MLSEVTAAIKKMASQDITFAESFNEQIMQSLFEDACKKLNEQPACNKKESKLEAIPEEDEEKLVEIIPSQEQKIEPKKLTIDLREAVFQTLDNYRETKFTIKTIKQRIIIAY